MRSHAKILDLDAGRRRQVASKGIAAGAERVSYQPNAERMPQQNSGGGERGRSERVNGRQDSQTTGTRAPQGAGSCVIALRSASHFSFLISFKGESGFFSLCFPLATALQSWQGCSPSKVFTKPRPTEPSSREYVTAIFTQATPCTSIQGAPI